MDTKEKLLQRIEERLTVYANWISQGSGVRSEASEDLYCDLLNTALGYELRNMNWVKDNFPAIDLGDEEERLAVQVTSAGTAEKVRKTLMRFYDHGLEQRYDRLIVLIAGKAECKPVKFDHPGLELEIWGTAELMHQFRQLPIKKLREVDEFLKERVDAPRMHRPDIHLPVHTSLGDDGFVGREEELARIKEALEKGVKPLVVWGLGGMGKTELVSHFGRNYRKGNVYLALFRNSFRDTVADSIAFGIPRIREQDLDPEQRYAQAMAVLRQCSGDDILIIDNADRDEGRFADLKKDAAYHELCTLPMHIIITTRFEVHRGVELKPLRRDELYLIFKNHKVLVSQAQMDALIDAVDSHTMTVDLMARTMRGGWKRVTADMLLTALRERNLPEQDYRQIEADYNRTDHQEQIYGHLRAVFNVAQIPHAAKDALCCAALLPQDGLDSELFGNALPQEPQMCLNDIIDHGWLQWKEERLAIHPVIRLVCWAELSPTDLTCGDFLDGLWAQFSRKEYDKDKFHQLAELFSCAAEELENHFGTWSLRAGRFWNELGQSQRALEWNLAGLARMRQRAAGDDPELAAAYNDVGYTYSSMGRQKEALDYLKTALEMQKRLFPLDHLDTARTYFNIGHSYGRAGDQDNALKNIEEALRIRKTILPPEHPSIARSYDHIGNIIKQRGEYAAAKEYMQKALDIRLKCLGPVHPDIATSYSNLGVVYSSLGEHGKALECGEKALSIQEHVLPPVHPAIARTCDILAAICCGMGAYTRARMYIQRTMEIAQKSLPAGHPYLERYRRNAEEIERAAQQAGSGE